MSYYHPNTQLVSTRPHISGVSNPSHETILGAGWLPYVAEPPEFDPDTERVENTTVEIVDGEAIQQYHIVALTEEEIRHRTPEHERIDVVEFRVGAIERKKPWEIDETVEVGDIREYQGILYRCIQAHTTQSDWTPDITPSLWASFQEPPDEGDILPWIAGEQVEVDDLRAYDDKVWRCIQAHTTQVGWEPPSTPALWEEVVE